MEDSTDAATSNKYDLVSLGLSSRVSIENKLFALIVKNINK